METIYYIIILYYIMGKGNIRAIGGTEKQATF